MSTYTDQAQVEDFLQRELTDNESNILDEVIQTAGRLIDSYTSKSWRDKGSTEDVAESTKLFDGNGNKEIDVDPFTTLTLVEILDRDGNLFETIASTDYLTYPLNSSQKDSIYLRSGRFPDRGAAVRLTGTFANVVVPVDVQLAAAELVGIFFANGKNSSENLRKESIEGYSYEVMNGGESNDKIQSVLSRLDSRRRVLI